jgi:NAD(P)-dependent dehydrogenase (short-subunit alcohol dehydrogenase family)
MDALFDLSGRVAVVTGAARGIGRAAAEAFARHGASLVLFDALGDVLEATAGELSAAGAPVQAVVGDVRSAPDVARLVETVAAAGGADVLVNSAGVVRRMDIRELSMDDVDLLWDVNARGTIAVTQALLPQMIAKGAGKIVNLGSLGSVTGLERRTAYATSKGAIALYTISLASEVGRYGITVNAIAPGYVETDMAGAWIDERREELLARIPLGRFAVAEELAGTFVFLAAPASDYITGQVLLVDGGWTTT